MCCCKLRNPPVKHNKCIKSIQKTTRTFYLWMKRNHFQSNHQAKFESFRCLNIVANWFRKVSFDISLLCKRRWGCFLNNVMQKCRSHHNWQPQIHATVISWLALNLALFVSMLLLTVVLVRPILYFWSQVSGVDKGTIGWFAAVFRKRTWPIKQSGCNELGTLLVKLKKTRIRNIRVSNSTSVTLKVIAAFSFKRSNYIWILLLIDFKGLLSNKEPYWQTLVGIFTKHRQQKRNFNPRWRPEPRWYTRKAWSGWTSRN